MTTTIVPARRGRAFELACGDALRIVNTHGSQVVDTWAVSSAGTGEHLSMEHTRSVLSSLRPRVGDALQSSERRPMLTIVEDTSPGVHDTLIAACDAERYRQLGHDGPHASCGDNFQAALAAAGLPAVPVPAPLNLFMAIPWAPDGGLEFRPSPARPGDRVTLAALTDVVVVLSACPMDIKPINGPGRAPVDVAFEVI